MPIGPLPSTTDLKTDARRHLDRFYAEYKLPDPEFRIVDQASDNWLGRTHFDPQKPETCLIEIQKRVMGDPETLDRVLVHELIHHADFLINYKGVDNPFTKRLLKRDAHGKFFRDESHRINVSLGPDYVTEKSDKDFVIEDKKAQAGGWYSFDSEDPYKDVGPQQYEQDIPVGLELGQPLGMPQPKRSLGAADRITLQEFLEAVEEVAFNEGFEFPDKAYFQCSDFSGAAATLAEELGLPVELYSCSITSKLDHAEIKTGDTFAHTLLKADGKFYDFTASQADMDLDFPHVFVDDPEYRNLKRIEPRGLDDGSEFYYKKIAAELGLISDEVLSSGKRDRPAKTVATATDSFLPEDLVMVDCEMTGVVPDRDKLLQIAMTRLRLQGNQYAEQGEPLVLYLAHKGQPQNDFHRKYLTHIFKKCNESDLTPEQAKQQIHEWLGPLKGKVTPVGDCVPTDIDFLRHSGCIDSGDIGDDGPIPGTFHYEYFDMHGIKALARAKMGKKEDKKELAGFDEEGIHDALVDCRNQTHELNHFIKVLVPNEHAPQAQQTFEIEAAIKPLAADLDSATRVLVHYLGITEVSPEERERWYQKWYQLLKSSKVSRVALEALGKNFYCSNYGRKVSSKAMFHPIIAVKISNSHYEILDGAHRAIQAWNEKRKDISALVVEIPKSWREELDGAPNTLPVEEAATRVESFLIEALTKEEIKQQYAGKTSFLYYPVHIDGETDEHHITVKFFDKVSVTPEQIEQATKGIAKTPPAIPGWKPVVLNGKKGPVKVLELEGLPAHVADLHNALEQIRPDDYPDYRPHVTVSDELWEKIKAEKLQPGDLGVQAGPLTFEAFGKIEKVFSFVQSKYEATVENGKHATDVYRNPSARELKFAEGKDGDNMRAFLDGPDLLVWEAGKAIHAQVAEQIQFKYPDPIPLFIYSFGPEGISVQVTDYSKRTKWYKNPAVAKAIDDHPWIKRLGHGNQPEISYYNEDVVGPWCQMEPEPVSAAVQISFLKQPKLWDGKQQVESMMKLKDRIYVVDEDPVQWVVDHLDIPEGNLFYMFYDKGENEGDEPTVKTTLPTELPPLFFENYNQAILYFNNEFRTFEKTDALQNFILTYLNSRRAKIPSFHVRVQRPALNKLIATQAFLKNGLRALSIIDWRLQTQQGEGDFPYYGKPPQEDPLYRMTDADDTMPYLWGDNAIVNSPIVNAGVQTIYFGAGNPPDAWEKMKAKYPEVQIEKTRSGDQGFIECAKEDRELWLGRMAEFRIREKGDRLDTSQLGAPKFPARASLEGSVTSAAETIQAWRWVNDILPSQATPYWHGSGMLGEGTYLRPEQEAPVKEYLKKSTNWRQQMIKQYGAEEYMGDYPQAWEIFTEYEIAFKDLARLNDENTAGLSVEDFSGAKDNPLKKGKFDAYSVAALAKKKGFDGVIVTGKDVEGGDQVFIPNGKRPKAVPLRHHMKFQDPAQAKAVAQALKTIPQKMAGGLVVSFDHSKSAAVEKVLKAT